MKKTILLAFFGAGLFTANAQTKTATLTVTLNPIQTIVVNPSQNKVNLKYTSIDNYINGVAQANADHLTIYSTGGFEVTVLATNLSNSSNSTTIHASTITVKPTKGARQIAGTPEYKDVKLSPTAQSLIISDKGGFDRTVSVEYAGAGGQKYMDKYQTGKTNIFTTSVTYSILAK